MKEEIDTTVSGLYALRAGLSAIAIEYDGFGKDCNKAYDNLKDARDYTERLEDQYKEREQALNRAKTLLEKSQKEEEEASRPYHKKDAVKGSVLFLSLGILLLLLCVYCIVGICIYEGAMPDWQSNAFLVALYTWWGPNEDWIGIVTIIVGLIGFFGGGASCGYGIVFLFELYDATSRKKKAQITLAAAQENYSLCKGYLEHLDGELAAAKENQGEVDKEEFRKGIAKKGNEHLLAGNLLYCELQKQFSALLDERDWGNLDYIIYALETGRADNLKEALQMCDRELQTERLERSIESAAKQISRTIERGLGSLQAQMEVCFHNLSRDIKESAGQISSAVSNAAAQTNARLAATNARLTQIASATALNGALLAKANENSAGIARDVGRLRDYADIHYRRTVR